MLVQNILKVATEYEASLDDDDYISAMNINEIFDDILEDYKKMIKKCEKEGNDVADENLKNYVKTFINGVEEEKEDVIDKIKERILILLELCENPPENIKRKYDEDTVSFFEKES